MAGHGLKRRGAHHLRLEPRPSSSLGRHYSVAAGAIPFGDCACSFLELLVMIAGAYAADSFFLAVCLKGAADRSFASAGITDPGDAD